MCNRYIMYDFHVFSKISIATLLTYYLPHPFRPCLVGFLGPGLYSNILSDALLIFNNPYVWCYFEMPPMLIILWFALLSLLCKVVLERLIS